MSVSKRLRFEVLRRDNYACRYCGGRAPDVKLVVDHVHPVALGGKDEPANLVTACRDCNAGKTSSTADAAVVADVEQSALRWARAMKYALEAWREMAAEVDEFEAYWDSWTYKQGDERFPVPKDADWRTGVNTWLKCGFTLDDMKPLVGVSMNGPAAVIDKWRYFCGCMWRSLDEVQDAAKSVFDMPSSDTPQPAPPAADLVPEYPQHELGYCLECDAPTYRPSRVCESCDKFLHDV